MQQNRRTDPEPGARLVDSLALALHAAARRKREELVRQLTEDAGRHVQRAWLRGGEQSRQLTIETEQEIQQISLRADALIGRIRRDAEHEISLRRHRLARSLENEMSGLDAEIEGVLAAVDAYRSSLAVYFGWLAAAAEPTDILKLARELPTPPDLETIGDHARADRMAELVPESTAGATPSDEVTPPTQEAVGVMDSEAIARRGSEPAPASATASQQLD